MNTFYLEGPGGLPGLKQSPIIYTNKPFVFGGAVTFNGTVSGLTPVAPLTLTGANANALAVGPNGTTNPSFVVNTATASAATGLKLTAAAAGGGFAIATTSSGANEPLTIDAKGSGTVTINGTATGIVVLPAGTTIGGSVPLTSTITSSSATAFQVGPNGATNPAFNIDASTALSVTGLNIKSTATGGGLALSVISSATNENLTIASKGTTGVVTINGGSTGGGSGGLILNGGGGTLQLRQSGVQTTSYLTVNNATAISSTAVVAFGMSSQAGFGIYFGSGAPTGSAFQGSVYLRSDGSSATNRFYINSSSGTGTTWTGVTTQI